MKTSEITIGTKNQVFKTIGTTSVFQPVCLFKIGQLKQAKKDLTEYFNTFREVLATGIPLTLEDEQKYYSHFNQIAERMAQETIERLIDSGLIVDNKFFTYLPIRKNNQWIFKIN